jgi:hypothetical protein
MDGIDLVTPGLVLILVAGLVGAAMQLIKGQRWIRPAYLMTLSMIAATALAVWGDDDLVSRQFGYILVAAAGLIALFVVGIGSMIAVRRDG